MEKSALEKTEKRKVREDLTPEERERLKKYAALDFKSAGATEKIGSRDEAPNTSQTPSGRLQLHRPGPSGSRCQGREVRKIPKAELTAEQKAAYSAAIIEAAVAKQRSELQRELPSFKPHCASGTWHTRGRRRQAD
jgi:hypothetical protein